MWDYREFRVSRLLRWYPPLSDITRDTLYKSRRRDDRNIPEWIKSEQITVSADDQIRAAVDGELEEFVVGRIAAGGDALGDRYQLSRRHQLREGQTHRTVDFPRRCGRVARREAGCRTAGSSSHLTPRWRRMDSNFES